MDYMILKEASAKWGVTPRWINYFCSGGRIPVSGPRDRNATGRLYQSGFGAGQGFGIFHYAAD